MAHPEVPYCGPFIKGQRHDALPGYKRAVSRHMPKIYPWPDNGGFTEYFGDAFEYALKVLQKRWGLQATGRLGLGTHNVLERAKRSGYPDQWAFDLRAKQIITEACKEASLTPDERIRRAILNAARYWYSFRFQIPYAQERPFALLKPPAVPRRLDCSEFATICHYAGGAPDPNGRGYDGQGYTGTLMSRGFRCNLSDLEIGDLIFYGWSTQNNAAFRPGDPTHVAAYAGIYDGAHMVHSMGSYPMGFYRYNYRGINHYRHYDVTP